MSAVLTPPVAPRLKGGACPVPGAAGSPRVLMTWDEFRAADADAGTRVEWLGDSGETRGGQALGVVWPVQGYNPDGTRAAADSRHNDLVTNLTLTFAGLLDLDLWQLQSQGAEVSCPTGRHRFPDFVGIRRPARFAPHPRGRELVLLNPGFVAEILSPSTRAVDFGEKAADYLSVPSVTDYLLIDPARPWVQHRRRADAVPTRWDVTTAEGTDASVTLAAPAVTLPLADLYRRMRFDGVADGGADGDAA